MRSAVTVSLVPEARGGPFVFWDGLIDACERASRLGFDAIEVFPRDANAPELQLLPELLARHALKVAAVGTGGGWVVQKLTFTHPDPDRRAKAQAFVREIVDLAGSFGASAIVGSMQGRAEGEVSRDQALQWLGESLSALGDYAQRHRVPLLYEPLNRYETNLHNRVGPAAAWLKSLPSQNVRILADLFHMNLEEPDLAAAVHAAGTSIGHVHFADSNRQAIGSGHTAIPPIISALRAIGYRGYLSAEVLALPDSMSAAERTIAAFRRETAIR